MEAASKGGNANEARLQDQQTYIATLQVSTGHLRQYQSSPVLPWRYRHALIGCANILHGIFRVWDVSLSLACAGRRGDNVSEK